MDSFIGIAVLARKRSTSYILNQVVRRFAILKFASFNLVMVSFKRSHEKLIGIWSEQELPARAPPMPLSFCLPCRAILAELSAKTLH